MRSVAGRRDGRTYTPKEAVEFLTRWFPRDRAIRVVAVAQAFGIKSEALPKGLVTLRVSGDRITIEVRE
jgi:hypothetical protein